MTGPEVVTLLAAEVSNHGSIKAAAWKWGMEANHLARILRGDVSPGLRVLKLLGLRRVIGYERV